MTLCEHRKSARCGVHGERDRSCSSESAGAGRKGQYRSGYPDRSGFRKRLIRVYRAEHWQAIVPRRALAGDCAGGGPMLAAPLRALGSAAWAVAVCILEVLRSGVSQTSCASGMMVRRASPCGARLCMMDRPTRAVDRAMDMD